MWRWAFLLGGLLVWAAHFFALYVIASLFPGAEAARWLTVAITLPALAAGGAILWLTLRPRSDSFDKWVQGIGAIGAALSLVAVLWQALPAILV